MQAVGIVRSGGGRRAAADVDEQTMYLALWLNGLGLASTRDIDTLGDVTEQVLCDVLELLLGGDDWQASPTNVGGAIGCRLQAGLAVLKRHFPTLLSLKADIMDNNEHKLHLLTALRSIHRAGLQQQANVIPKTPQTPVSSFSPSPSSPSSSLLPRILHLLSLGSNTANNAFLTHRLTKVQRISPALLSDGLLLCLLAYQFEELMGVPHCKPTVQRAVAGGVWPAPLLFLQGVDAAPKTRAARMKNIESALSSVREWKKFPLRHLFGANSIADAAAASSTATAEGCGLVEDMVAYTETRMSLIRGGASSVLHQQHNTSTSFLWSADDEEEEEEEVKRLPPPSTPPFVLRLPSPSRPSPPPPPPPPLSSQQQQQTQPYQGRLSRSRMVHASPPPPPPPPPPPTYPPDDDEDEEEYHSPPARQPSPLPQPRLAHRPPSSSSTTTTRAIVPPLLCRTSARMRWRNDNDAHWLREFLHHRMSSSSSSSSSMMMALDAQELHHTYLWLFRLGFNLLRTNMHDMRQVPAEASCSREFYGYVGGPVMGDPVRNGRVHMELLVMLTEGDGEGDHRAQEARFELSGKQRLDYASSRLVMWLEQQHGSSSSSVLQQSGALAAPMFVLYLLAIRGGGTAATDPTYEERTCWDKLFRLGLVVDGESMNARDVERISSGEILFQWLSLYNKAAARGAATTTTSAAATQVGRTRKTCVSAMAKNLDGLGVVRLGGISSNSEAARRIHDGDFRLFFSAVESVPDEVFALALEFSLRKENATTTTTPSLYRKSAFQPYSSQQKHAPPQPTRRALGDRANTPLQPQHDPSRYWSPSPSWGGSS